MRKLMLLLGMLICQNTFGQNYHWDFAISTGFCPLVPMTYPFDYNALQSNLLKPLALEVDYNGNAYVLGTFRPIRYTWPNAYQITPNKTISAINESQVNALYLYKIDAKGEVVWANSISHLLEPLGNITEKISMSINPYSGKVYIIENALDYIFVNQEQYFLNFDNSRGQIKRMMLCFNEDGTFNKALGSVFILDKPIFSSVTKGVFRASKLAEFYPYPDSISFYHFNAQTDSIEFINYANGENILLFDKVKNVYVSDQLSEYSINLTKTKNGNTSLPHLGRKLITYKRDKAGNTYFLYNVPDYGKVLVKYNLNQIKSWEVLGIETFDVDSANNPWIFTPKKSAEIESSDVYLSMLDASNGSTTKIRIEPTNLIQQTNEVGLFKISENNSFFIGGFLYNEAEFGDAKIGITCGNEYLALQHYVARAREGWKEDRKNVSLDEKKNTLSIKIYPNPFTEEVTIETNHIFQNPQYIVTDLNGSVQNIAIEKDGHSIKLNLLAPGVYFLSITDEQISHSVMIMKQ